MYPAVRAVVTTEGLKPGDVVAYGPYHPRIAVTEVRLNDNVACTGGPLHTVMVVERGEPAFLWSPPFSVWTPELGRKTP